MSRRPLARVVRFGARHLLLLNVVLCAAVWIPYGSLRLYGNGPEYWQRTQDVWLTGANAAVFDVKPGLENVLLPGLATILRHGVEAAGLRFSAGMFVAITIVPYVAFIYGLSVVLARRREYGPVLAVATPVMLYTSGLVPYMTNWGGYVDGMTYLLLLPLVVWPRSLPVYLLTVVLQCLNHYLGVVAIMMWTVVWYGWDMLEHASRKESLRQVRAWLAPVASRVAIGVIVLLGFHLAWRAAYPEGAAVRAAIVAAKWTSPAALVDEVFGPFPMTIASTFKLGLVPLAGLVVLARDRRVMRAVLVAAPFVLGSVLTLLFVDVTRVLTIVAMPAVFLLLHALRKDATGTASSRRRLRNVFLVSAILNLVVPNFYVNNGQVLVPRSTWVSDLQRVFTPD